jgi:hypothetical protein
MVAPGCTKRLPPSGSIVPAAIRISVDLPEPLRPTSATFSPGSSDSAARSSNRLEPSVKRMSCRLSMGAAATDFPRCR